MVVSHNYCAGPICDNVSKDLSGVRFGPVYQTLGDGSQRDYIMGAIEADADMKCSCFLSARWRTSE
jgi:hypothetical protein